MNDITVMATSLDMGGIILQKELQSNQHLSGMPICNATIIDDSTLIIHRMRNTTRMITAQYF
jgi:hypothetical protein